MEQDFPADNQGEVLPPCAPIEGGTVDPCERRLDDWWCCRLFIHHSPAPWWPADVPWDAYEWLESFLNYPEFHSHAVVRATVIPGSTRCVPITGWAFSAVDSEIETPEYFPDETQENCFIDIRVNEYLFAGGPGTLTLLVGLDVSAPMGFDDIGEHREFLEDQYSQFEGYEYVLQLIAPMNRGVLSWQAFEAWDVQKNSRGETVAVSRYAASYRDKPQWLNKIEIPLSDIGDQVRRANTERLARFRGKVGDGDNMPLAIQDISPGNLSSWILQQDVWTVAVDLTPVLPPPIPDGDDPYTPGQNILDETATATPEVPGGLEETETPGPLGDDVAKSTAEPTITPEPAPTPDG